MHIEDVKIVQTGKNKKCTVSAFSILGIIHVTRRNFSSSTQNFVLEIYTLFVNRIISSTKIIVLTKLIRKRDSKIQVLF